MAKSDSAWTLRMRWRKPKVGRYGSHGQVERDNARTFSLYLVKRTCAVKAEEEYRILATHRAEQFRAESARRAEWRAQGEARRAHDSEQRLREEFSNDEMARRIRTATGFDTEVH
jgi:hypothetical protein